MGRGNDTTYNANYRRARHLRLRYGLTEEGYQALYKSQEGRCAICGEVREMLHIDHDHETGAIRGLLCFGCNNGLGAFKDDVTRLASALNYLSKEPAALQLKLLPRKSAG